jgi:pSer/pThr/pTyr-binding forkhead associated (FHA) protein
MFTLIIEDRYGAIVDEYSFEDGEFVVGRSQSCDIVLAADNVSRRHARLFTVEGRCYIEDLNAANGVWLSGKRIYNVTELPRSAQVRIGDFFLHIEGAAFAHPLGATPSARLLPTHGASGGPYDLNRPTVLVGRGKDCAIVIHDPSVSRIHAKLTVQGAAVTVEDLRSSNGTWVNERRIDSVELRHGDRVRFGTVGFQFAVEGEELPTVEPPASWPATPQASASAEAPAFRGAPPVSGYGMDASGLHESQGAAAAYPSGGERSWLPQIALVAVLTLAVAVLVVFVGFAYDRLVAPALVTAAAEPAAAAVAASPPPTAEEERALAFKAALARGADALASRDWIRAEEAYREARRHDPVSAEPTRALNRVAVERRAHERFLKAEEAFKRKDYAEAIRQHRLIDEDSVYQADARKALEAIAGILEIDADAACAGGEQPRCKELYALALTTGFARASAESKYKALLAAEAAAAAAPSKRRRRR